MSGSRLLSIVLLLCAALTAGCGTGESTTPGSDTADAQVSTPAPEQSQSAHDNAHQTDRQPLAKQNPEPHSTPKLPDLAKKISAINIPYSKFVLDNGLTVIVHEDHDTPIVAVNIWYHVGSKNEGPDQHGFAHLFEHLMFQGSEHWDGEYFEPFERAGATAMNGTTNVDRTNYFADVPTPALDMALWMESDRMGNFLPAISKARLEEQTGVVLNEKRQGANQPYGTVWSVIPPNTYPTDHPYSWPTIGSAEDLKAATLEDARNWFKKYYNPSNATLVLAGDIDPQTAKKMVEKYFGWIPAGPPLKHQQRWIAPMEGVHRQIMYDQVPQARVYKVWNIPGAGSPAEARLSLIADLLAGSKTSRLYQALVYDKQLATSVSASIWSKELGSQFVITATAREGVPLSKVEKTLNQVLKNFLKQGPTTAALKRSKARKLAGFLRSTQRVGGYHGKASILARGEVFHDNPAHYKQYLQTIKSADAQSVAESAREWLSRGRYVLEVLPFGKHSTEPSRVDRTALPDIGAPTSLNLPNVQHAQLDNGMKIWLAPDQSSPVIEMRMILDAGYAADPAHAPGTASLALAMMDEGTTSLNALEISARLDRLGAIIGTGSSLDASSISLSALPSMLDQSVALYADIIRHPSFPKQDFARLKKQRLAAIAQEKASPGSHALRLLGPLLYGEEHAYGVPLTGSGTVKAVKQMRIADLEAFHRRWVRPDNATLVVVGDIDMQTLKPILVEHFGDWPAPDAAPPLKNLPVVEPRKSPRVFLVNRPGSSQSTIIAANLAPPRSNPVNIGMNVANTILGGMFNSRLNLNLREDKHWSYGASSLLQDARAQQLFFAYAAVQTDKTAESMREIHQEIRGIATQHPPTAPELNAAQAYLTRSLPGSNETASALASTLAQSVVFGLPDDYYEHYVSQVRSLDVAAVSAAADVLLDPNALTWIVIGDLSRIGKPIEALHFGPIQVLKK